MSYAIDQTMRAAEDSESTIDTLREELAAAERERDELRERDAFLMRERIAVATALDVPYATDLGEAVALRLTRLAARANTDAERIASLRQERDAADALLYSEREAREAAEARLAGLAVAVREERGAADDFDDAESEVREADRSPVSSLKTRMDLRVQRDAAITALAEARRATNALLVGAAVAPASAGQLVANAMSWLDAKFYEKARGTEIDPAGRDDNVKEYLDHWRDALVVPWVRRAADAVADRDTARQAHATLAAVVREYLTARDALTFTRPEGTTAALRDDVVATRAALDAALAGCP